MVDSKNPIDLVGRLSERLTGDREEKPAVDRGRREPQLAAPPQQVVTPPVEATPDPVSVPRAVKAELVDPQPAASGARKQQPVIEIDLVRLQKEGFLTPQNQRSLIAEEYRVIKRPLLRAAFDRSGEAGHLNHVVMVTSAKPNEGKTFTSINLAMSVASERDLYVLLVDCDIRRMELSTKLGIAERKGIMDVLLNPSLQVSDVMLKTNIPNLAVIPSGQPVAQATELFASQGMTKLVDDLASRYPDRFIIFDTPPILASSEPGVLAMHVGHVIIVVAAGETSRKAITESLPLVNSCPNVHFVLNRAQMVAGRDRFGYYGSY
jgi:protein-tyrosine kinase